SAAPMIVAPTTAAKTPQPATKDIAKLLTTFAGVNTTPVTISVAAPPAPTPVPPPPVVISTSPLVSSYGRTRSGVSDAPGALHWGESNPETPGGTSTDAADSPGPANPDMDVPPPPPPVEFFPDGDIGAGEALLGGFSMDFLAGFELSALLLGAYLTCPE